MNRAKFQDLWWYQQPNHHPSSGFEHNRNDNASHLWMSGFNEHKLFECEHGVLKDPFAWLSQCQHLRNKAAILYSSAFRQKQFDYIGGLFESSVTDFSYLD